MILLDGEKVGGTWVPVTLKEDGNYYRLAYPGGYCTGPIRRNAILIEATIDDLDENGYLNIPESVIKIERSACYGLPLTGVYFPEELEIIENQAFEGCKNLASINLAGKITKIGDMAFYDCPIQRIEIVPPLKTVINWGEMVFGNRSLANIGLPFCHYLQIVKDRYYYGFDCNSDGFDLLQYENDVKEGIPPIMAEYEQVNPLIYEQAEIYRNFYAKARALVRKRTK